MIAYKHVTKHVTNVNMSIPSVAICARLYTRSPVLGKLFNRNPFNSTVKWRAKVAKILFISTILYKSLHMVLGSGGSDEAGWKPRLFVFSSSGIFPQLIWPLSGEKSARD